MNSDSPYKISIYEDHQIFYPSDNTIPLPNNIGPERQYGMSLFNPAKKCGNIMYYLSDEKHTPVAMYLFGNESDIQLYCKSNGLKIVDSGVGIYSYPIQQYTKKTIKDIQKTIQDQLSFKADLKAMSDEFSQNLNRLSDHQKRVKEHREYALKLKEQAETDNTLTDAQRNKMLTHAIDILLKKDEIRSMTM